MSKDLTLYDLSRMLKDAGFPQPEPSVGQLWYGLSLSPFVVNWIEWCDDANGDYWRSCPAGVSKKIYFDDAVYRPTIEDIMPKLPSWLSLECDVDRKTGEVTWSLVTRRHGLIMVGDLHWVPDPQKDPVIACGLAWLYFHSKKADHGKVDTE